MAVLSETRSAPWQSGRGNETIVDFHARSLAHRFVLRGIHEPDRATFIEKATRLLARYLGTPSRRRASS